MTYYLYIKTHNVTGLKYLGQTVRDPFTYRGSGKIWVKHLNEYGNNVSTAILLATESKSELQETGIFFSNLLRVEQSSEWANILAETGTGFSPEFSKALAAERIANGTWHFSQPCSKNRNPSSETRKKMSDAKKGKICGDKNPNYGKKWSEDQRTSQSERMKLLCSGKNNPMYGKSRADVSARNKQPKRWVTDGKINHLVLVSKLDEYLSQGFRIGRS